MRGAPHVAGSHLTSQDAPLRMLRKSSGQKATAKSLPTVHFREMQEKPICCGDDIMLLALSCLIFMQCAALKYVHFVPQWLFISGGGFTEAQSPKPLLHSLRPSHPRLLATE